MVIKTKHDLQISLLSGFLNLIATKAAFVIVASINLFVLGILFPYFRSRSTEQIDKLVASFIIINNQVLIPTAP